MLNKNQKQKKKHKSNTAGRTVDSYKAFWVGVKSLQWNSSLIEPTSVLSAIIHPSKEATKTHRAHSQSIVVLSSDASTCPVPTPY